MTNPEGAPPPSNAPRTSTSNIVVAFLAGLFTVIAGACWHYRGPKYFAGAVIVGALILYGVVRARRRAATR